MTKEDRELAIADNVAYVAKVLAAVADEFGITRPLIYAGFSQGVAMAYRAAALVQRPCDGVIALAGDRAAGRGAAGGIAAEGAARPRHRGQVVHRREGREGSARSSSSAGVTVIEHVFEGGHVWAPEFIAQGRRIRR